MTDQRPERGGAWDFHGQVRPEYAPVADGDPDPGEVVWVWVPFEEDPGQGKDRPVVIIGRDVADDEVLVALMLSSKDHDGDERWHRVGPGAWDGEHRSSWVRVDRPLATAPAAVRREGSALDRTTFLAVVEHAVALGTRAPARIRTATPGARRVTRLVGVYRSRTGPLGEVVSALGRLVGRTDSLRSVSDGPLRRKNAWDQMCRSLGVPFDLVAVGSVPPEIRPLVPTRSDAPVVIAEVDGRLEKVLGPSDIEPCAGSVVSFEQTLVRTLRRRHLSVG